MVIRILDRRPSSVSYTGCNFGLILCDQVSDYVRWKNTKLKEPKTKLNDAKTKVQNMQTKAVQINDNK